MTEIQEIKSAYEDFDRVLSEFASEIDKFTKDMYGYSDDVIDTVDALGEKWKKIGYDDFKKTIKDKIGSIKGSLERCDKLSVELNKLANQLKEELEKLRSFDNE